MTNMKTAAIVVAGGKGVRMGQDLPKQFLPLKGVPILIHTLQIFWGYDSTMPIVIVMNGSYTALWEEIKTKYLSKEEQEKTFVCVGGEERIHSVENGMRFLQSLWHNTGESPSAYCVAVHDAVRPLASKSLIEEAFNAAIQHRGAVPCVPVKFSLRQKVDGQQTKAVSRAEFLEVQTPQCFHFEILLNCLKNRPHDRFTDEASLFESMEETPIAITNGSYNNIKITTPEDLWVAESLMGK
jgi:2-C-methyl-D-erythritol 4-phosphate cytidylyltransferase